MSDDRRWQWGGQGGQGGGGKEDQEVFRRLEQEQRQTGDNSSGQVRDYWVQGRNGGKTDFRVFLACIILKYQNGFLICINRKITNSNLHNALPKTTKV